MPAKTSKGKRRPMKRRGASATLAKRAKPSGNIGRPLAKIDEARVAELAFNGLSNRTIAVLVGVDHKTIGDRFSPILAFWRAKRCEIILQAQWDILNGAAGPAGAVRMAIWLGKQYLGQSERPAVEHPGGLSVKVNITAYKEKEAPESAGDKTCLPDRQAVIDVTEVRQANRLLEGPAEPTSLWP